MSTETGSVLSRVDGLFPSWVGQYLRDHAIHIAIVLLFAAYPFVYDFLVGQFGLAAQMVLLRPRTMLTVLVLGLFAMSFDFISGYTGYLSFGHAAFFGIGAYFVVLGYNGQLPVLPAEMPFMVLLLLGALLAVVAAFFIGLISFRLTGVYFAMITLGIAELMYVISSHWNYLTPGASHPREGVAAGSPSNVDLFEPQVGVPFVDTLQVEIGTFGDDSFLGVNFEELGLLPFGVVDSRVVASYLMLGVFVLLCYLMMQRIIHSPFGRVMIAIRENEERAAAIGYNTFTFKMGAFMISAFFGGVAGGLLVAWEGAVDPQSTFFFLVTGFALIAAILGGLGTLAGAMFGYIFLEGVEEFLSREGDGGGLQPFLEQTLPGGVLDLNVAGLTINEALDSFMTGHGEFYAGIIFVLFVLYVPIGMLGTLRVTLGTDSVAKYVSRRIDSRLSDGDEAAEDETPADGETESGGETPDETTSPDGGDASEEAPSPDGGEKRSG